MPMSIKKIAHLAGVSVATVSRVLNNSDSVKDSNREKVLQAIANSNYQPNLLARQLRTARSSMILVMVSDIANPFCAEVVKGIEEQAEQNHYRILLCNSASDVARSRSSLQLLAGKIVDGVITMDAFSTLPELAPLIGARPWVQCAEYADDGAVSCVGINDVAAAQQLVGYLADGGRQRIALINHDLDYKYAQLRQQAINRRWLSGSCHGRRSATPARCVFMPVKPRCSRCWRRSSGRMRCLPSLTRWPRAQSPPLPGRGCACRRILPWPDLTAPSWRKWSRRR